MERVEIVRREITYYTCTPCEKRTGKEVKAERITVDGRTYDLCAKDRKLVDQYLTFRDSYALTAADTSHTVQKGRVRRKQARSGPATQRYECGHCRKEGRTNVVAKNSRSWHASHHHNGLKMSEIDWYEV